MSDYDYAAAELLETETDEELAGAGRPPVLPVQVTGRVITDEVTPQDCVTTTIVLSAATITSEGAGIAELLPADPLRVSARVLACDQDAVICHSRAQAGDAAANGAAGLSSAASFSNLGTVTSPGASAVIATIAAVNLIAGMSYQLSATGYFTGTPASPGDDDNFGVNFNAVRAARIPADGAILGPQAGQPVIVPNTGPWNGINPITVTAIAAGAAGAIYHAQLTATPLSQVITAASFPNGA